MRLTWVVQRRLSSSVRTLATAASTSSSTVVSRPRLDALRAQGLGLDDFLGGDIERVDPARVVFTKSKQCVHPMLVSGVLLIGLGW